MIFTLSKAKDLILHYKFLIGKESDKRGEGRKITDLLITPIEEEQFKTFTSLIAQGNTNEEALLLCGCDPEKVEIRLIYEDGFGIVLHSELDKYLTKMAIEKIY